MKKFSRWVETTFETFLFNARLIVILAVLGSLTSSVLMFVRGAMSIFYTALEFVKHPLAHSHEGGEELSVALISSVDSFLFATVLLIFAMGIYELFISKIDPASRTATSRPNWLQIHSLDDLKGAVGKVILMILIVRLFESAVKMKYDHPLHLLYLGLAVLFVAAALYLQHLAHRHEPKHHDAHAYPPAEKDEDTDPQRPLTLTPDVAPAHAPVAHAQPRPIAAHSTGGARGQSGAAQSGLPVPAAAGPHSQNYGPAPHAAHGHSADQAGPQGNPQAYGAPQQPWAQGHPQPTFQGQPQQTGYPVHPQQSGYPGHPQAPANQGAPQQRGPQVPSPTAAPGGWTGPPPQRTR